MFESEEKSPAANELVTLASLMHGIPIARLPAGEEWTEVLARLQIEDSIAEINEETWYYFLEVLPPKILRGNWFCFAEGHEPLKLFWLRDNKYYGRQLNWDQTRRLCDATGLSSDYGYS